MNILPQMRPALATKVRIGDVIYDSIGEASRKLKVHQTKLRDTIKKEGKWDGVDAELIRPTKRFKVKK